MATAAEELKKKTQSFKMGGASGFVPGIGSGDKVPAKYEPGEFVVSRDMLALDPKLGAHLTSLREMALAKQGMTPEQADAKAMMGGKLHAARGFGDFELTPIDPAKEIPQTKMAKAMQNATRINSRLPPPAWAPATPQPAPVIQAPNLTTSPGATPTISGPPAPPKPISAPSLGFSEGAHRDNRINFNTAPEPVPVNATTSMGAAPGRAVVPVSQGRSFTPPYAALNANPSATIPIPTNTSPANSLAVIGGRQPSLTTDAGRSFTPPTVAPRSTALVPVDAGRGFTPPYGASLDRNTIYQPPNTSPNRALATISSSRDLALTGDTGRATTAPTAPTAPTQAAKQINIPSGYTPPKVNPATGAYANQGPAAPLPMPESSGRVALAKGIAKGVGLGAAGYGAARLMNDIGADSAPGTNTETRANVNAIPTGGNAPAPAAQPYSWWTGSETGRNVGNTLNALAPMGGAISGSLRAGSAAARLAGAGEAVAGGMAVGANGFKSQDAVPPAVPVTAPTVTPAAAPQADIHRGGAQAAPAPAPAPEADATGKVQVTRQPNGIMEFSGKDITGDPQYTGSTGFKAGGFGVSSLGGPIAPSAASQAALTNPDGSRWSAQDSAVMAANMRDGIDAYQGTSRQAGQVLTDMGGSMGGFGILDNAYKQRREVGMPLDSITASKGQKAAAAAQLQALDAQDMQRLREGGDMAANNKTVNDMARQRLGFDAQRVAIEGQKAAGEQLAQGFGLRSSQRMEDAQKALLDPNATPAARKLAQENLINLSGKAEHGKDNYIVTRGGEEMNPDGMTKRTVPERIFDSRTGQYVDQPQAQAKQSAPPAQAVAMLKANPKMAADFDAKYGAGAAAQIMGQK